MALAPGFAGLPLGASGFGFWVCVGFEFWFLWFGVSLICTWWFVWLEVLGVGFVFRFDCGHGCMGGIQVFVTLCGFTFRVGLARYGNFRDFVGFVFVLCGYRAYC